MCDVIAKGVIGRGQSELIANRHVSESVKKGPRPLQMFICCSLSPPHTDTHSMCKHSFSLVVAALHSRLSPTFEREKLLRFQETNGSSKKPIKDVKFSREQRGREGICSDSKERSVRT